MGRCVPIGWEWTEDGLLLRCCRYEAPSLLFIAQRWHERTVSFQDTSDIPPFSVDL